MPDKHVLSEWMILLCPKAHCEDLCLLQSPPTHQSKYFLSSHHVLALCQVLWIEQWAEQLGICPLGASILVMKTDMVQVMEASWVLPMVLWKYNIWAQHHLGGLARNPRKNRYLNSSESEGLPCHLLSLLRKVATGFSCNKSYPVWSYMPAAPGHGWLNQGSGS